MEKYLNQNGVKIHYNALNAENEKARILIVHGLGEHAGTFSNIIDHLLPKNISCWTYDLRGHGKSDGPRGHIDDFDDYVKDTCAIMKLMRADCPENIPFFLMGDSFGGMLVLHVALKHPSLMNGVIASSPGLGLNPMPWIKRTALHLLLKVKPDLPLNNRLDFSKACRNKEWVLHHSTDPLVNPYVTPKWFSEFSKAQETLHRSAADIKVPVLMQISGNDSILDSDVAKRFFNQLTVKDKTLHCYDDLCHYIFFEPPEQRHGVLMDLEKWVMDRIGGI
jgi:alpha-beta hydrolase superfamily lysophospholipase